MVTYACKENSCFRSAAVFFPFEGKPDKITDDEAVLYDIKLHPGLPLIRFPSPGFLATDAVICPNTFAKQHRPPLGNRFGFR